MIRRDLNIKSKEKLDKVVNLNISHIDQLKSHLKPLKSDSQTQKITHKLQQFSDVEKKQAMMKVSKTLKTPHTQNLNKKFLKKLDSSGMYNDMFGDPKISENNFKLKNEPKNECENTLFQSESMDLLSAAASEDFAIKTTKRKRQLPYIPRLDLTLAEKFRFDFYVSTTQRNYSDVRRYCPGC